MLCQLLALLIVQISTQEWYIPNSHIINETQFTQLVVNDKSTFKLVKFFTPYCVYCRYLKNTIDTLKAEKEWNFQIYDFNCGDYPQKCFQLGVSAYPFIIVFNQNGDKEEQLLGNYPLPVLQEFFNKIEQKNRNSPQQQEQKPTNLQQAHQNKAQQVIGVRQVNINQKQESIPQANIEEAIKNPHEMIQTIIKHIESQPQFPKQQMNTRPIHLQGYSQDIFFCLCILLGVSYFSNISQHFIKKTVKSSKEQNSNPEMSDELGNYNKKQIKTTVPF